MVNNTISYLAAFGLSWFFWFIGNEYLRGKIIDKPRGFWKNLINVVVGNPRYDYMFKFYGSILMSLVLACAVLGLPSGQMASYWRVIAFHGFVLIVAPVLVGVSLIEFVKKRIKR